MEKVKYFIGYISKSRRGFVYINSDISNKKGLPEQIVPDRKRVGVEVLVEKFGAETPDGYKLSDLIFRAYCPNQRRGYGSLIGARLARIRPVDEQMILYLFTIPYSKEDWRQQIEEDILLKKQYNIYGEEKENFRNRMLKMFRDKFQEEVKNWSRKVKEAKQEDRSLFINLGGLSVGDRLPMYGRTRGDWSPSEYAFNLPGRNDIKISQGEYEAKKLFSSNRKILEERVKEIKEILSIHLTTYEERKRLLGEYIARNIRSCPLYDAIALEGEEEWVGEVLSKKSPIIKTIK